MQLFLRVSNCSAKIPRSLRAIPWLRSRPDLTSTARRRSPSAIFDEFHHTGAPQWSRGVEGVIECNPDANLIGLSATSIRYSDSGRDMSDELFDGHIASYMSLTDCWVLGILPVPTYVTAGYSINGYIEDLGERIAKEESAGRRAELLADFNELRDCASRAANLPAIFQKYFEGIEKVIVFCPNVFELNEIEKMCPQWFSRVNGNVHTYVVHSSNPFGTSEYDGFKEDDDETAIKLLLCVNQLNEGVHIKGVDAVIMVRRTSSPTIFYQQLGRALTAAGNFEPLVIDLVDNFEMIGIEQIVNMMSESYARLSIYTCSIFLFLCPIDGLAGDFEHSLPTRRVVHNRCAVYGCRRPLDYSQRSSADNRSVIDPFGIDLYLPPISYLHFSCSPLRHFWRDVGSAVLCTIGHDGGSRHLVPNFSKGWKPTFPLCCLLRIRSDNRL